mmetsp:Transcript_148357/g.476401  ORF Transcript_148357/g.476401 Transcript_148357/m.476401 type:complete len:201 (-) Transcript_148357:336-938(-)
MRSRAQEGLAWSKARAILAVAQVLEMTAALGAHRVLQTPPPSGPSTPWGLAQQQQVPGPCVLSVARGGWPQRRHRPTWEHPTMAVPGVRTPRVHGRDQPQLLPLSSTRRVCAQLSPPPRQCPTRRATLHPLSPNARRGACRRPATRQPRPAPPRQRRPWAPRRRAPWPPLQRRPRRRPRTCRGEARRPGARRWRRTSERP